MQTGAADPEDSGVARPEGGAEGMHGQDGAVTAKMTKVKRTGEDNLGDRRNGKS